MENSKVEICFIGNAIVDILAKISNETLNKLKIPKGSMQLIDEGASDKILEFIQNLSPGEKIQGKKSNRLNYQSFMIIFCLSQKTQRKII